MTKSLLKANYLNKLGGFCYYSNARKIPPPPQNEKQKQMREEFWKRENVLESKVLFSYLLNCYLCFRADFCQILDIFFQWSYKLIYYELFRFIHLRLDEKMILTKPLTICSFYCLIICTKFLQMAEV